MLNERTVQETDTGESLGIYRELSIEPSIEPSNEVQGASKVALISDMKIVSASWAILKYCRFVCGKVSKVAVATCLAISFVILLCMLPQASSSWGIPTASADSVLGQVTTGTADLSSWNGEQQPTLELNGEWEFYWEALLEPKDFQSPILPQPALESVPQPWTAYKQGDGYLPNEGYATYRLRFLAPEQLVREHQMLGIYPKSIASAYRLWVNGDLKGGNGTVGTSHATMQPASYPKTFYFEPVEGWNEIVIQVSNFSQRNAGIWQEMEIGMAEGISWLRVYRVATQMFTVGIFCVMSLYYLLVYLNQRQDFSALLFSLLCIAVGVRTVVLGETTALYLLPSLPWEWAVKAEYISISMTGLILVLFIHREYPAESHARAPQLTAIVMLGCTLLFLLLPARVYTYWLVVYIWCVLFPILLYTTYVYARSVFSRRKGSFMNAMGFLIFMIFALNDMLFYSGLLPTDDLLSMGLLAFLLTQALNLSYRFSSALQAKEELSAQLLETNRSLERTVEERTQSLLQSNSHLQEANRKMADIEQFRVRLLANISHELSTPITSIKGFAKALRDGIITQDAPKYANRIYERSILLEQMILDLIELTKLETNQSKLHMQEVELLPFMKDLFNKYEYEIADRGIQYEQELPPFDSYSSCFARLDPVRIEQVLSNVISNALRFTTPPGAISLHVRMEVSRQTDEEAALLMAVIRVQDTGIGIDPSMHEHIFERFGQVKGPGAAIDSRHTGSGLGLAICKEIIHHHGGDIWVDSKPGAGSGFYFSLPVWIKKEEPINECD